MIYLLLFASLAFGRVCEVTLDSVVIGQYEAAVCDRTPWGGKFGHINAIHTENVDKTKDESDRLRDEKERRDARVDKLIVIKAKCNAASGVTKDICEYLTN